MQEHCILLGCKENPYSYIKNADLYLQTSYVESQSITVYEALVLKKLIITSDLPALREALNDGELGILCKPESSAFADTIKIILLDKAAQNKLQEAVREYVVSNETAYQSIKDLME